MKYIIVYGDLIHGHQFVGPFEERDAALLFAEGPDGWSGSEWWIAELNEPEAA